MNTLKEYISEVIGLQVSVKPFEMKGQLPMYLLESYNFSIIHIEKKKFLTLELKDSNNYTISQLEKHQQLIEKQFDLPTLFIFNQLEAFNRKRLIERKIGFVIPFKQLYVPQYLIDLKETGLSIKTKKNHLTPTGQLILLLFILDKYNRKQIECLTFKELATLLKVKPMEITRAVANLYDLEIVEITGIKDKKIQFNLERHELWNYAVHENLFINPIFKTIYTEILPNRCVLKSNTSALPEYSDMNPSKQDYYAIDKNDYAQLKNEAMFQTNPFEGKYCIEIWKYNPIHLSEVAEPEEHVVDPLSLYLSLRNNTDARIEMALDQIIDKYTW